MAGVVLSGLLYAQVAQICIAASPPAFALSNAIALMLLMIVPVLVGALILVLSRYRRLLSLYRDKELKLAEAQVYKTVVEENYIVAVTNRFGVITHVNDQFCRLSQYARDELIGNTHKIVNSGHHGRGFFLDMWRTISSGKTWRGEVCNRSKNGALYWLNAVMCPVLDRQGKIEKYISIRFDITNRKNVEHALEHANDTLKAFIKHAPASVAMFDREMNYIAHTDRWCKDHHLGDVSIVGQNHYQLVPQTTEYQKQIHRCCLAGEVICIEEDKILKPDGSEEVYRWEGRPWQKSDGSIGGIVILTENISERKAAEQSLRASEERFRSLFLLAPVGVSLSEIETGRIVLASEAMANITGYSTDELYSLRRADIIAPEFADLDQKRRTLLAEQGRYGPFEKDYIHKDGQRVPVLVNGVSVKDHDGRELSLDVVQDVTSRRTVEERFWRLANIDSLTGLPNRMLFHERLNAAISASKRNGDMFAVGLVDLDNFKEVNDSFGHDAGDLLLKIVAERLSGSIRETDTVARLGGDEFAFIITGAQEVEDITRPIHAMYKAMAAPIPIGQTLRRATLSIGVTLFPSDALTSADLIKNADMALYRAKGLGRACFEMFVPEMRTAIERTQQMRQDFEEIMRAGGLSLHYQPMICLKKDAVCGFEALLRLQHPTRGLLTPQAFMQIFDDPAITAPVGERVFELALQHVSSWLAEGVPFHKIALNVTSGDFRTGRFSEDLAAQLSWYGIDPSRISIEITEGMFMGRGADSVQATLKRLKEVGVEIVLDDFGTGFASISDLKKFPIDRLKIDRSFIASMAENENDASIVRAVIQLGHSLDMKVTAEGVETETQLEILRGLGCDQIQGWIAARPMPPGRLPRYLRQSAATPWKKRDRKLLIPEDLCRSE